jgi:hypothetical protein
MPYCFDLTWYDYSNNQNIKKVTTERILTQIFHSKLMSVSGHNKIYNSTSAAMHTQKTHIYEAHKKCKKKKFATIISEAYISK